MNWTKLWMDIFGKTELFGLNMGFWVAMTVVLLIVILMNVVFWNIKPKKEQIKGNHKNIRHNEIR